MLGEIKPEMMFQNCHWGLINFFDVGYHSIFSSFNLELFDRLHLKFS